MGRDRRDRAGDPDEPVDRVPPGDRGGEQRVEVVDEVGDLGDRRRVAGQEALGQADRADVERHGGVDLAVGTAHELGRPTPDVDHQRGLRSQLRGRTEERGPGLRVTGQDLGVLTQHGMDGGPELVGVLGVPRRGGGAETHRVDPHLADRERVLARRRDGALDRGRIEASGAVDALPQAHDPHVADQVVGTPVGAEIGDQEPDRVGPAVDRRDASHGVHLSEGRSGGDVGPSGERGFEARRRELLAPQPAGG